MFSNARLWCIGAAALLASVPPAAGQEFCSQPVVPYCASGDAAFDTSLQINSCRRDLDNYVQELADYEQCIDEEIETLRRQVADTRDTLEEVEEDL